MPKVIVLLCDGDTSADDVGFAAAEGAKGVRFTEVDVRTVGRAGTSAHARKPLESAGQIREYDGIIVACTAAEVPVELGAIFDDLERGLPEGGLLNKVFGATSPENQHVIERLSRLGGIIVCTPREGADAVSIGGAIGARVAKVAEWVRHALSHEQTDHHHHP